MASDVRLLGMVKVCNATSGGANTFKKVTAENFPDLLEDAPNPGSINENECTSGHILVKFRDITKRKSFHSQKENTDGPQGGDTLGRCLNGNRWQNATENSTSTALRENHLNLQFRFC